MQSPVIRSIVDADNKIDLTATTVNFSLKPHKVFLFDAETEARIYFGMEGVDLPTAPIVEEPAEEVAEETVEAPVEEINEAEVE